MSQFASLIPLIAGFGPKILGFPGPDGVPFNLRAFPLGGYVKFPPNYDIEEYEDKLDEWVGRGKFKGRVEEVRLDKERSDGIPTQPLATQIARACTSIQESPISIMTQ